MPLTRSEPPKAVTFDFWNTLIREDLGARDRRTEAWLGLLEGEGIALERQALKGAVQAGWGQFQQHWNDNIHYGAGEWIDFVLGELGLKPPAAVRQELLKLTTDPSAEHDPQLTDNIMGCLAEVKAAGVRIGIICDVGLTPSRTLRQFLDRHDVLGYFDHWSFSDEVGVYKPDPVIFRHAMAGLGIDDPTEAAHIGDLRRTDVAGAKAIGFTAIRYSGVFDDPPGDQDGPIEADLVIADHAELPAALGF